MRKEIWVWVYLNKEITKYKVSNLGHFISFHSKNGRQIFGWRNQDGYVMIKLCHNGTSHTEGAHRIVAKQFIKNDNPLLDKVHHKNYIKNDNRVYNLKWVTNAENIQDAFDIGAKVAARGEDSGKTNLTNNQVLLICRSTKSAKYFAKKYNIHHSTVHRIRGGTVWGHITGKKPDGLKFVLSKADVMEIYLSTLNLSELAQKYKVKESRIYDIKKGRRWADITGAKKPNTGKPREKLTKMDVIEIFTSDLRAPEMAKLKGVTKETVFNIRARRAWASMTNKIKYIRIDKRTNKPSEQQKALV